MADQGRDYRIGRKLPRHYYEPAERIQIVPGVTYRELDDRADMYAGSAEDLERAGVLRAHMLPAPGHVQIAWNPASDKRKDGRSSYWTPGHLTIRRHHDGTYRARLVVSFEEQERRRAHITEFQAECRKNFGENGSNSGTQREGPEKLRKTCLDLAGAILLASSPSADAAFEFTQSAQERIARVLDDLEEAIRGAQIVSKRHTNGGKGHLRVAWSAT